MLRPVLKRDDKIIYIGETENDCYVKLHNCQGQSWDWAIRYEGYKVVTAEINRTDYTDDQWKEITYNGIVCSYNRKKMKMLEAQ